MARNNKVLSHRQRLNVMLCAFLLVGVLVIARLAQMQLVYRGELRDYYRQGSVPTDLIETVRGTIYSRDGEVLARDVPEFDLSVHYSRTASYDKVWYVPTGKKGFEEALTLQGDSYPVNCAAFSPDGKRIATGSTDGGAKIWDAVTGREVLALKGHSRHVTSVCFSRGGTVVVTGSFDGTAKLWDVATGNNLLTLKGHLGSVNSVAFSPDAGRLVTGSSDATAKLWDTATGKDICTLKGHSGPVNSVAFGPDGRLVVTGSSDATVKLWDASTGSEVGTLKGHSGPVNSVAFAPDGGLIGTGSSDGTVKLWDASTGKEVRTLKGRSGAFTSVAFSPDGGRIITGSSDAIVKLWDASTGKVLRTLRGHSVPRPIASVAFSPDGLRILFTEQDWRPWAKQVCGLTAEEAEELEAACRDIRRRVERIAKVVGGAVQEQDWYHPVVRNIRPEVAALLSTRPDMCPAGLRAVVSSTRVYPSSGLAPHIVGRCSQIWAETWTSLRERGSAWDPYGTIPENVWRYRMNDTMGVDGIEKVYEGLLRGTRGYEEWKLIFHTLSIERRPTTLPPEPGLDVHLTLRADFQRAANETLQWAAARPGLEFKSGAIVVMDVRDGAVLAAATYWSYDPENLDQLHKAAGSEEELRRMAPFLFRPTQAALPVGSVYKPVTAIAALEEGKIDASTTFHCAGSEVFASRTFRCTGQHGNMTLLPAIERSCNVYFYHTGIRTGGPALARWGKALGMGAATGIDLPSERAGRNPEPRSLLETVNLSIGQGSLLCTPMQVVRMFAAIANGGTLVQPHFFDRATTTDGEVVRTFQPTTQRTVRISPETLRLVREGMRRVVQDEGGTAREAGLERFDAAGKTGTAELGGDLFNAWFAGYAPFENPKIAFVVVSERTHGHGGSHAAPIMAHLLGNIWSEVENMQ